AAEQARALRAAGVAHEERGRVALRADVARSLAGELDPARRRELAARLARVTLDAHARAHVAAALGDREGAREAWLRAIDEARAAGDPERAAAIGREGLAALPGDAALAIAAADALRARAREREALALLEDVGTPEAAALCAELA